MKIYTAKASRTALGLGTATLLCLTSLTGAGHAQDVPALSFHPVNTTWAVDAKPIEIASAHVQNCTISNTFNNGFVMRLNGSHKWVQSLTLDLKQDALKNGKGYNVALSVPGIQQTTVKGRADNAQSISINLKGQKALYKAMRDAAVLDVDIEGNDFRFYMVNFAPAAAQFERCMAGGDVKPKTTQSADATPLKASISEDPFAAITANESIALEAAETRAIIDTAANLDDPKPVAKRLPYKETKKLGDAVISETAVSADGVNTKLISNAADTAQAAAAINVEAVETIAIDSAEALTENAAPLSSNKRTLAENAVERTVKKPRKRFTERLAAQIKENPEIAAIDDSFETKTALIEPESVKPKAPVAEKVKAPEPKNTQPRAPLAIPSIIKNIPLDTVKTAKKEDKDEPVLPKPAALTAEELNQQQLEKIKNGTPRTSTIKTAKIETVETEKALAFTTEVTDPNAPFSTPLKPVKGLSDPSVKDKIKITTTPAADKAATEKKLETILAEKSIEAVPALPPADENILLPEAIAIAAIEPEQPKTTTKNIRTPRIVNKVLSERVDADFTNLDKVEPASSGFERSAYSGADPDIGRKISQLERTINRLEAENDALKDELDTSLEESREERLSISSENWNLERATQRFNEAERQLKSFGQQLQRERAQCNVEKKELESLLFDPEVTNEAQLARLADLERKLIKAEKKLKAAGL